MKSYKQKARNFMKNTKAISPIFATLILIAIAVIAGVVVYMFTSGTLAGMTSTSSAGQEKISVQSSGVNAAGTVVTIYAQQTAGPGATPSNLIIKDSSGNTVTTVAIESPTVPALETDGTMAQGTLYTITHTAITALSTGTYTATLVTQAGGSFVSPSFTV